MKSPLLFVAALATSISVTAFLSPSFAQAPQQQQMQGQADEEKGQKYPQEIAREDGHAIFYLIMGR